MGFETECNNNTNELPGESCFTLPGVEEADESMSALTGEVTYIEGHEAIDAHSLACRERELAVRIWWASVMGGRDAARAAQRAVWRASMSSRALK